MDYHCPSHQNERPGRPVRAYLLEPDIPEEDRMIEVHQEEYQEMLDHPSQEPDSDEKSSEDDAQGKGYERRSPVDAA